MTPREIIAKAWTITKTERTIRRWGYVSALLETLLNLKLIIYQVWFLISYLNGDPIGFFTLEETIMHYVPFWLFLTLMFTLILVIAVEWLFPNMAKGAIIGLAAKSYKKEELKGGLVLAVYNFFPIFAIHEFFFLASITTIITIISLVLRYGNEIAPLAIPFLILLFLASLVLQFFCIFAEEAVVIRKHSVWRALASSFKLIISHLSHIMFLLLLFFVVVIRVLINAVMFLLIPAVIIGVGFLSTLFLPHIVTIVIMSIFSILIIGIASYFFAYLLVFKQTVWTLTYMELSKLKDLDIIEDGEGI